MKYIIIILLLFSSFSALALDTFQVTNATCAAEGGEWHSSFSAAQAVYTDCPNHSAFPPHYFDGVSEWSNSSGLETRHYKIFRASNDAELGSSVAEYRCFSGTVEGEPVTYEPDSDSIAAGYLLGCVIDDDPEPEPDCNDATLLVEESFQTSDSQICNSGCLYGCPGTLRVVTAESATEINRWITCALWEPTGATCEVATDEASKTGKYICFSGVCLDSGSSPCDYVDGELVCPGTVPEGTCSYKNGVYVCGKPVIEQPKDSSDVPVEPDLTVTKDNDGDGNPDIDVEIWRKGSGAEPGTGSDSSDSPCGGVGQPPCNSEIDNTEENEQAEAEEFDFELPEEPDLSEPPYDIVNTAESGFPEPADQLPGDSSCPEPLSFEFMENTIEFSFEPACDLADMLRPLVIAFAYIAAFGIAFRR